MREIGRNILSATWCAWVDQRFELLRNLEITCHFTSCDQTNAAFDHADRAQVAIPALDGMFFDEAVAAQQLHAVGADLHALVARTEGAPGSFAAKAQPCSARLAARYAIRRIASSSSAMSAIMNETDWRWLIGSPKAMRSLQYAFT